MCTQLQLTKEGIHKIFNGSNVESPIFQVLRIRNANSRRGNDFFLTLSDGTHYSSFCVVGTQLKWIVEKLTPNSEIRVNRYVCGNISENRKVIIILDMDILRVGEEEESITGKPIRYESTSDSKISVNPTSYTSQDIFSTQTLTEEVVFNTSQDLFSTQTLTENGVFNTSQDLYPTQTLTEEVVFNTSENLFSTGTLTENSYEPGSLPYYEPSSVHEISNRTVLENSQESPVETLTVESTQPGTSRSNQYKSFSRMSATIAATTVTVGLQSICNLTPNLHEWTICARVTNKSKIIPYQKDGENCVRFLFDMLDETGEIRATVFNEECDKFYDMIKVDQVYYITHSKVKESRRDCNPMNHDYEINFDYRTQVQLCETETNIPRKRFTFVSSINKIKEIDPGTLIDVIGVCKKTGDKKITENGSQKRDIQIVDKSRTEVLVTLWEFQAETFEGSLGSAIAIKGARVKDFRGKNLSVSSSSIVVVNPDIKESDVLRMWYELGGWKLQTENISNVW